MNLDEMAAKKSSFFSTGIKRKAEVVNLSPIACMKLLRLIKSLSWKVRQRRTFLHHGAWLQPALTAGQILNGIPAMTNVLRAKKLLLSLIMTYQAKADRKS